MPSENDDILGSEVGVDADDAVSALSSTVQADEGGFAPVSDNSDTTDDASGPSSPFVPMDMPSPSKRRSPDVQFRESMRNSASQARAEAAMQQAERQRLMTEATRNRVARNLSPDDGGMDAANARAASRPYIDNTFDDPNGVTISAPADTPPLTTEEFTAAQRALAEQAHEFFGGTASSVISSSVISSQAPAEAEPDWGPRILDARNLDGSPVEAGALNKGHQSRVIELAADRETAGPSPSVADPVAEASAPGRLQSPPRFASYKEYTDLKEITRRGLADDYTSAGRPQDVGSPEFNRALEQELVGGDLLDKDTPSSRLQKTFRGSQGAFAIGYSTMMLGQEGGHLYSDTNDGRYHTPEEIQTAQSGMLPGALGLAGTLIGAAVGGPAGALFGQFAGQAVGQVGSSIIGAGEERSQATRQTADMLAASTGAAGAALDQFKQQIENAGVAVQQMQEIVGSVVNGVGPVGASFVSNSAPMVNALGEYAQANYASIGHQIADSPALFGMGQTFRAGSLTGNDYGALGLAAAFDGNAGELYQDNLAQQHAPLSTDPAYQAAARRLVSDTDNGTFRGFTDNVDNAAIRFFGGDGDKYIVADNAAMNAVKTADTSANDAVIARNNAVFEQVGGLRASNALAQAGVGATQANVEDRLLLGGGAGAYAANRGAFAAGVGVLQSNDAAMVGSLQAQIADPANKGILNQLNVDLAQQQQKQSQDNILLDQFDRSAFEEGYSAETKGFGLSYAARTYSGASAVAMAGDVAGQVGYLNTVAANSPWLSPADRSQVRTDALQAQAGNDTQVVSDYGSSYDLDNKYLEYHGASAAALAPLASEYAGRLNALATGPGDYTYAQRRQMQSTAIDVAHSNQMAVYAQQDAGDDLTIQRGSFAMSKATTFGGAADIQSAGYQEIEGYARKIADLNTVLASGNLTYDDRIAKEKELTQAQAQAADAVHSAATSYFGSITGVESAGATQAGAFAGVAGMTGGSAASLLMLGQEAANMGSEAATHTRMASDPAFSTAERAGYAAAAAGDEYRQSQVRLSEAEYSPDPGLQTRLYQDQGALTRMSQSFIEPGNYNDMRGKVFADIGQELTGLSGQEAALKKQQGGALYDYQETEFERQRQQLLTERADIGQQMDTSYFDKLPAITVGGTSEMGMYLPSYAQTALNLERRGFGTLAARNFGFQNDSSYNAVIQQAGGLSDAGHTLAGIEPGNQSAAALAQAVKDGFSGSTIHIVLTMPDGSTQKVAGQIQTTNQRTQGMGVFPGVGK